MVVNSRRERMRPLGFRTAAGGDENGDQMGRKIWDDNGLDVEFPDTAELYLALGDAYMMVGDIDPETGSPVITGEDPRQVVTIHAPDQQRKVLASAKFFHDSDRDRDVAYLYITGRPAGAIDDDGEPLTEDEPTRMYVAYRDVRQLRNRRVKFSPRQWSWDDEREDDLGHHRNPVVRFRRRRGVGVFEKHTDLLDRITWTIFNRMVIMAMQAFRQRAIEGDLPTHDEAGNEINYEELFAADPGVLWELPEGIKIWESQLGDLGPALTAAAKDLELVSAVMKLPLSHLVPSAVPQTAEGASLAEKGLVFAVEDENTRCGEALRDVMSIAFLVMGQAERAERSKIEVLWAPAERLSLAERADAASKVGPYVPKRTLRTDILQFPPAAVERMEIEDLQEQLGAPAEPQPEPVA
jgi:hypothetical protein